MPGRLDVLQAMPLNMANIVSASPLVTSAIAHAVRVASAGGTDAARNEGPSTAS